MTDLSPNTGPIALVTGASRGIGRAAALALAQAGYHVIATARTEGALVELDDEAQALTGRALTLVPAKLENGGNVDRLGGAILSRWGKLDVLVHAAAQLGPLTPVSHLEAREFEKTLTLNLTAAWRLIRSVEPLLRRAEAGRAVFLTSSRASRPKAYWGAYAASKAGLEALVGCWADELEHTAVRATLLDPGAMRTRMRAEAYPGEDAATLPDPAEIGPLVVELADPTRQPPPKVSFREWAAGRGA